LDLIPDGAVLPIPGSPLTRCAVLVSRPPRTLRKKKNSGWFAVVVVVVWVDVDEVIVDVDVVIVDVDEVEVNEVEVDVVDVVVHVSVVEVDVRTSHRSHLVVLKPVWQRQS
jgi:hypothetical protein